MEKETEQPPIGGFCDDCGHFAARHGEEGCDTSDLVKRGIRTKLCNCVAMKWRGRQWPRPWLPAPEGLKKA